MSYGSLEKNIFRMTGFNLLKDEKSCKRDAIVTKKPMKSINPHLKLIIKVIQKLKKH